MSDVRILASGLGFPEGPVSMADGSVQFLKESVEPAIVRSLFTLAGGPGEFDFDAP